MGKRTYLQGQKPLQIILLNNSNDYIISNYNNHGIGHTKKLLHARGKTFVPILCQKTM